MNIMNPVMNNRNGVIHKSDCMEVLRSSAAAQGEADTYNGVPPRTCSAPKNMTPNPSEIQG